MSSFKTSFPRRQESISKSAKASVWIPGLHSVSPGMTMFSIVLSLALVSAFPSSANAACSNPTGVVGEMIYNTDHSVMQFCDDTNWISMGANLAAETDPEVGTLGVSGKWCTTDGSVVNCTSDAPAGTPAGTDGQIQFNDGGTAFGGDSKLIFNKTTGQLTITGNIAATSSTATSTLSTSTSLSGGVAQLYLNNTGAGGTSWAVSAGNTATGGGLGANLGIAEGSNYRMVIAQGGNVGIGTTGPGAELEVSDTASDNDVRLNLRANGSVVSQVGASSSYLFLDSGGARPISFWTNSSERMRINSDGNVGIGTASPTERLDVNGTVKATSFSGLSGSFARVEATAQAYTGGAWNYSSYVACPGGYTLINHGMSRFYASGNYGGGTVSYGDCQTSGNSVRAMHFSAVANLNFLTTCFALCAR